MVGQFFEYFLSVPDNRSIRSVGHHLRISIHSIYCVVVVQLGDGWRRFDQCSAHFRVEHVYEHLVILLIHNKIAERQLYNYLAMLFVVIFENMMFFHYYLILLLLLHYYIYL